MSIHIPFFDDLAANAGLHLVITTVLLILVIVLIILVIKQAGRTRRQQKEIDDLMDRYSQFMQGSDGLSMEQKVMQVAKDIRRLDLTIKNQKAYMENLNKRLHTTFRKSAIVRYNSFAEAGGIMSFVLVMLDENNDGFILNVIQSREGSYPYMKRVDGGEAEAALGREEARALEMAMIQG